MSFVSCQFLPFLLAVWALFLLVPARFRFAVLLAASYVFYAAWSIPFIGIILLTTSIDYFASLEIQKSDSRRVKRFFLWTAIAANLLVLGIFKYFNFFLETQQSLCSMLGCTSALPRHLNILLPLGISYYSFEAISYLVDVYRGMKPASSWWTYNFYIMYFPHLLSGPIVRFGELWRQYREPIQRPSAQRIAKGLELIVLGYFFKLALADSCAAVADPTFAHPEAASTLQIYTASLAFATQIYMDFLGYTHIARGTSLLFNIQLPLNFDHPLWATNMSNFWQRWQMSLSKWLHDYVFVPLGGARKSLLPTMRNVFITLLIAGIWHGAGWTYVILGCYFGGIVALYHAYRRARKSVLKSKDRLLVENPIYKRATHALTFWCIVVSAVLFRAPSVHTDAVFLGQLARLDLLTGDIFRQIALGDCTQIAICFSCIAIMLVGPLAVTLYQRLFLPAPYWVKIHAATALALICWIVSAKEATPFIYFQF